MRYFFAGLGTESHSGSVIPTDLAAFRATCLFHGDASTRDPTVGSLLRAWRTSAAAAGDEVIESLCAFAQPGAPVPRAVYEELRDELLHDLDAATQDRGPVDVVILLLHGAMLADGYDDCEGDLLARVRERLGPGAVVGALLDLHAHLTPLMLRSADLLISYQEYPHTDVPRRAELLFQLCTAAARAEVHPVMAVHDCKMLGLWPTTRAPLRDIVREMRALESGGQALAVSFIHGFPWGDTPDRGAKVLVVTDRAREQAEELAARIGRRIWVARAELAPPYVTIDAAIDAVQARRGGLTVLADVSDNPDGGATGDATHLLRQALLRGLGDAGKVLAGLYWDPDSTARCLAAGVGAVLELQIGGKAGPRSGAPLALNVRVLGLSPPGIDWPFGDIAWVRAEETGVELLLGTTRRSLSHPALFGPLGIEARRYRVLIVKSANHFEAGFAPLADTLLRVVGPGDTAPFEVT